MALTKPNWGNNSTATCSELPVNKFQIIIYNVILILYWIFMLMGLQGLWQIPIAICNIASFNLEKRLNLASMIIGQVVKSPKIKSIFGLRGIIGLATLNIILFSCDLLKYYLEIQSVKYIVLSSTLLVILYLIILATRRVEIEGTKMTVYEITVVATAFMIMMIAEYYDDYVMCGIAILIVSNDWFYVTKLIKAGKECCFNIELTNPFITYQ